jgi:hypothetical protein
MSGEIRACSCGCGENAKPGNNYILGHNSRVEHPMLGKKHSEETRKKLSESHMGLPSGARGLKHSGDTRRRMSESHKGVPLSGEHRKSIGAASIRTWAAKSNEEREQWAKNISVGEKGKFVSEETKKKCSISSKILWRNPDHARKCLVINSPNKAEMKLLGVLNTMYPGEWKFVGDGQVIIGGKYPDFINVNGAKKIIELYGERWHQQDDAPKRIGTFKPFGYETLIIWYKELRNIKTLKQSIALFCEGK